MKGKKLFIFIMWIMLCTLALVACGERDGDKNITDNTASVEEEEIQSYTEIHKGEEKAQNNNLEEEKISSKEEDNNETEIHENNTSVEESKTILEKNDWCDSQVKGSDSKEEGQGFNGYIIDKDCSEIPGPEEDTIDCLLMDDCRKSGYGLAVKSNEGYRWYAFDAQGQELVYKILRNTEKYRKISVAVSGILENDIIKVSTMVEK